MTTIRPAAVAGAFYPDHPKHLGQMVDAMLAAVDIDTTIKAPKAIIAPHAGYIYSGPVAAAVYARLRSYDPPINRVVLIGPSHRMGFAGLAISHSDYYQTPLGSVSIDHESDTQLLQLPFVSYLDEAHRLEHSLEVQLPFLQRALKSFTLIPLVAGDASAEQVCHALELVWGGSETLIVISSDLSHYHDYATAQQLDRITSDHIVTLHYERLDAESACGRVPVSGLLAYARQHKLRVKQVDLKNSGDTAGDKHRVVGYGAYVIE